MIEDLLKEGGSLENVGLLTGRFGDALIVRVLSPEGKVYYYCVFLDSDEDEEDFIEVLDKTEKEEEGYPVPFLTEGMILGTVSEGYLFYPSLLEKYHFTERVGGKPLKDWYEGFLGFFEAVQGKTLMWCAYEDIFSINIPRDEWPDYWALTVWEREGLMHRFERFASAIWNLTWVLVEKVALKLEKRQGKTTFSLQDIVEFLGQKKPVKAIRNILGHISPRMGKDQEEWIYSIVWQKLQEAAKEDRNLTLNEVRMILGYED
jgi:hypothetical protein